MFKDLWWAQKWFRQKAECTDTPMYSRLIIRIENIVFVPSDSSEKDLLNCHITWPVCSGQNLKLVHSFICFVMDIFSAGTLVRGGGLQWILKERPLTPKARWSFFLVLKTFFQIEETFRPLKYNPSPPPRYPSSVSFFLLITATA